MMDFSSHAGVASGNDTIPNGQLAWAILNVRGVKNASTGSSYLDCELTLCEGQPYAKRKVFDKIGHPFHQGNSEAYRQMGMVAITRIMECGRGAGPNNPAGYKLDDFQQLDGLKVAIKIGIEEGTGGHDDKNRVSEWLTPNPASKSGFKWYDALNKGIHSVSDAKGQQAQPPANGFGRQTSGGFGNGGSAASGATAAPVASGFGNGSGFQAPPANSSGPSGASGATTAESQSQSGGATASPSDPAATPGWLAQAGPKT